MYHVVMPEGIDVHGDKGRIDWVAVRRAGVEFAFVKCSEGLTFEDARIAENLAVAAKAGILVGPYHYARPDLRPYALGAVAEADAFVKRMKAAGWSPDVHARPALDLEEGGGDLSGWALAFLLRVEEKSGVRPILYTYSSFATSYLTRGKHADELAKYLLWLANYSVNDGKRHSVATPSPWKSIAVHQYTSSGSVSGVGGRCDRNYAADIVPLMGKAVLPKPVLQGEPMWAWIRWWRGRGEYKPFGPRNRAVRPDVAQPPPKKWWDRLRRNLGHKPPSSGGGSTPRSQ